MSFGCESLSSRGAPASLPPATLSARLGTACCPSPPPLTRYRAPAPASGPSGASPATQPLRKDGREIPCPARPHLAGAKQRSGCLPPPSPSPRRAVIITSSLFLLRSLGKEPENSNSSCRGRLSYKTLRWVALRLATTPKKAPVLPARTWRAQQRPPPPKPEAQALLGATAVAKGTSGPSPSPRPQCPYTTSSKHLPSIPRLGPGGHLGLGGRGNTGRTPLPHPSPLLVSAPGCIPLPGLAERDISHLRLAPAPRVPVCQQPCRGALQPGRSPAADPGAPAVPGVILPLPERVPTSLLPPTQPPRQGPRRSGSQHRPLPAPTALAT